MKCVSLINSKGELVNRAFLDSITINKLNESLGFEVTSIPEFYRELNEKELNLDVVEVAEESDFSGIYEVNIIPYHSLGFNSSYRFNFMTEDFDREELDALLGVPEISEIMVIDKNLSKLLEGDFINKVNLLNIISNYLETTYGFKITVLFSSELNEKDSID